MIIPNNDILLKLCNKINKIEETIEINSSIDKDHWCTTSNLCDNFDKIKTALITLTTVNKQLIDIIRDIVPATTSENKEDIINKLDVAFARLTIRS